MAISLAGANSGVLAARLNEQLTLPPVFFTFGELK